MRASEAIAAGQKLIKGQAFGGYVHVRDDGVYACVVGCATLGTGYRVLAADGTVQFGTGFKPDWPEMSVFCPIEECQSGGVADVGNMAVHLNDQHKWSIDKIKEWVKGYE